MEFDVAMIVLDASGPTEAAANLVRRTVRPGGRVYVHVEPPASPLRNYDRRIAQFEVTYDWATALVNELAGYDAHLIAEMEVAKRAQIAIFVHSDPSERVVQVLREGLPVLVVSGGFERCHHVGIIATSARRILLWLLSPSTL